MSLTFIFIGITIALSLYAWNNQTILNKWIMHPYSVKEYKEYYRFLTSGFLHADYGHLFFNMLSLYFFGFIVEKNFSIYFGSDIGSLLYAALYLLGIIVANVPSYADHKNDRYYNALGASGGVSAVVFSAILFQPTAQIYVYFFPMPGFIYAILYSFYSYYMSKRNLDNIGHSAHLYGAAFGVAFTLLLKPSLFSDFISQILSWSL
ncbi:MULTISPECIES: rhomboid family intramembrane serine protease [unclassified Arcicella]|uniref:rhomboid family intramembrane serine protease n=1 Tax=unclassified Arcicella TaxID=2644986 RepID=UPI00285DEEE5|nr:MULTISPECIES: rhomboid family intramembrane serine protease [unclassified Arcicella]MDR6563923.1 membrane associated rhomboid family serine protease [Arcicella sp. BE51]MDR6813676.1 membrane associated rhomboid family serine protease [Arcicella sp. BE140]MDR6824943.1 membrane associated rhomboid family serine protease [Arcicella sp. BE139]